MHWQCCCKGVSRHGCTHYDSQCHYKVMAGEWMSTSQYIDYLLENNSEQGFTDLSSVKTVLTKPDDGEYAIELIPWVFPISTWDGATYGKDLAQAFVDGNFGTALPMSWSAFWPDEASHKVVLTKRIVGTKTQETCSKCDALGQYGDCSGIGGGEGNNFCESNWMLLDPLNPTDWWVQSNRLVRSNIIQKFTNVLIETTLSVEGELVFTRIDNLPYKMERNIFYRELNPLHGDQHSQSQSANDFVRNSTADEPEIDIEYYGYLGAVGYNLITQFANVGEFGSSYIGSSRQILNRVDKTIVSPNGVGGRVRDTTAFTKIEPTDYFTQKLCIGKDHIKIGDYTFFPEEKLEGIFSKIEIVTKDYKYYNPANETHDQVDFGTEKWYTGTNVGNFTTNPCPVLKVNDIVTYPADQTQLWKVLKVGPWDEDEKQYDNTQIKLERSCGGAGEFQPCDPVVVKIVDKSEAALPLPDDETCWICAPLMGEKCGFGIYADCNGSMLMVEALTGADITDGTTLTITDRELDRHPRDPAGEVTITYEFDKDDRVAPNNVAISINDDMNRAAIIKAITNTIDGTPNFNVRCAVLGNRITLGNASETTGATSTEPEVSIISGYSETPSSTNKPCALFAVPGWRYDACTEIRTDRELPTVSYDAALQAGSTAARYIPEIAEITNDKDCYKEVLEYNFDVRVGWGGNCFQNGWCELDQCTPWVYTATYRGLREVDLVGSAMTGDVYGNTFFPGVWRINYDRTGWNQHNVGGPSVEGVPFFPKIGTFNTFVYTDNQISPLLTETQVVRLKKEQEFDGTSPAIDVFQKFVDDYLVFAGGFMAQSMPVGDQWVGYRMQSSTIAGDPKVGEDVMYKGEEWKIIKVFNTDGNIALRIERTNDNGDVVQKLKQLNEVTQIGNSDYIYITTKGIIESQNIYLKLDPKKYQVNKIDLTTEIPEAEDEEEEGEEEGEEEPATKAGVISLTALSPSLGDFYWYEPGGWDNRTKEETNELNYTLLLRYGGHGGGWPDPASRQNLEWKAFVDELIADGTWKDIPEDIDHLTVIPYWKPVTIEEIDGYKGYTEHTFGDETFTWPFMSNWPYGGSVNNELVPMHKELQPDLTVVYPRVKHNQVTFDGRSAPNFGFNDRSAVWDEHQTGYLYSDQNLLFDFEYERIAQ